VNISKILPDIHGVVSLLSGPKRLLIAAYGFEDRALGWSESQEGSRHVLHSALLIRYFPSKGYNNVSGLDRNIKELGDLNVREIRHNAYSPHDLESDFDRMVSWFEEFEEIVIDTSAMTKLLILVCLCKLVKFSGRVRIVYVEANSYAPTEEEYQGYREGGIELIARMPSRGVGALVRMACLSSIRMQGQPVSMIAFASFNEQLVRHMLGTITPHNLFLINGRPPRSEYKWREAATQEIHQQVMADYIENNPSDSDGRLKRSVSTLDYKQTTDCIDKIYDKVGNYERIICAATGSKMQTVGLFFAKILHPDIHIEYPTPDSYYVTGLSAGVREVHEVTFDNFSKSLKELFQERNSVSSLLAELMR
jgi:hypothetical protein